MGRPARVEPSTFRMRQLLTRRLHDHLRGEHPLAAVEWKVIGRSLDYVLVELEDQQWRVVRFRSSLISPDVPSTARPDVTAWPAFIDRSQRPVPQSGEEEVATASDSAAGNAPPSSGRRPLARDARAPGRAGHGIKRGANCSRSVSAAAGSSADPAAHGLADAGRPQACSADQDLAAVREAPSAYTCRTGGRLRCCRAS